MPSLLTATLSLASTAALVAAQSTTSTGSGSTFTPLVRKRFDYDDLPYKADPNGGTRGTQYGYNRCNATTEGQDSLCQTATINSIDDFCLWGPPEPNSTIGDTEGEAVAWCTKPGRGTRLIPQGALTGVQFLRAPAYVQVVGLIDQTFINIAEGDYGGEMDPHGADQRGNPLGGLIFSQAFSNSTNTGNSSSQAWRQVIQWHNFMGSNTFCLKACDPDNADGYRYCEHIYDRIGCHYNAPAAYREGVFQSCESDNMLFPGYYVGDNGQTSIYTQPPESLGVISTLPYEPVTPSSSMCTNYTSASIYTALPTNGADATTVISSSAAATSTPASAVRPINNAAAAAPNATPTGAAGLGMAVSGAVATLAAVAGALAIFA